MNRNREERADEAREIVKGLVAAGWSKQRLAKETGASVRTVYRWLTEGRAPHPVLLGALRGMAQQGAAYENREGTG